MVTGQNGAPGVNVVHLVGEEFRQGNAGVMILHLNMEGTVVLDAPKIFVFATPTCALNTKSLHPGPHGC